MRLMMGHDKAIRDWVSAQVQMKIGDDHSPAIGFVDGETFLGGIVYHDYRDHMIDASIATVSPRWCNRTVLRAIFSYPFKQLGCERFQVTVVKNNKKSRSLVERLGFKNEGCLRCAYDGKKDVIIYGMLKHECKWIES